MESRSEEWLRPFSERSQRMESGKVFTIDELSDEIDRELEKSN